MVKESVLKSIFIAFIVTIYTMIIQFVVGYIDLDDGEIIYGPVINNNNQKHLIVNVANYNSGQLNNLLFRVPTSVIKEDILSSCPLEIIIKSDGIGTIEHKRIALSGFPPKENNTILIPLLNNEEISCIKFLNADEKDVEVRKYDDLQNPIKNILKESIIIASIISLVAFFFILKIISDDIKSENRRKEVINTLDNLKKESDDILVNAKKTHSKLRIILLSKISAYSKELAFWRDTIRKVIYQSIKDKNKAEELIEVVTETLKTYKIQSKEINDDDTLEDLLTLLSETKS